MTAIAIRNHQGIVNDFNPDRVGSRAGTQATAIAHFPVAPVPS